MCNHPGCVIILTEAGAALEDQVLINTTNELATLTSLAQQRGLNPYEV